MHKLLIVEDTDSLRDVLATVLEQEGFLVDAAASAEESLPLLKSNSYDCILADFKLPEMNGLELLKELRNNGSEVPYIIMTAYGSIELAVDAMKSGANDFISKPFESKFLCANIKDVIAHNRIINREPIQLTSESPSIETKDPEFLKILSQAKKVAQVDSTVLLLGESGTGKELTARFIHEHSKRKDEPFVAINCAAIPSELLESELFGHSKGSFTGATQDRKGLFEYASKGTIFLDEIGDMPTLLQVKLLRALQEGEIRRIGSNTPVKVNPRIIAATHKDLEDCIATGHMREDFYYRIAVISFQLPPLRKRPDDIEMLTRHFIDYFARKNGRPAPKISKDAMDFLRRHPLPGNTRELENVIQRAVILSDDLIEIEHLGLGLDIHFDTINEARITLPAIAEQAVRKAEIDLIMQTLRQTMGNKSKAAKLLGVSYKTLLNKVKEYQLSL
ncbi:MAG: sigma-54-dependent Fis family transcriptional regulator [SAR324 cluster bacterium]|uniref:Sigma-54-dependent Fis family transcriptional regulator n=1 Tax=SAR324 cluster bacterium TaxID=2024889 RepID=A0A7X9FU73_9DELT|nr:sigma-54-dependent Fis family transcriptional regulator [SAR324 cluster bacterium]